MMIHPRTIITVKGGIADVIYNDVPVEVIDLDNIEAAEEGDQSYTFYFVKIRDLPQGDLRNWQDPLQVPDEEFIKESKAQVRDYSLETFDHMLNNPEKSNYLDECCIRAIPNESNTSND